MKLLALRRPGVCTACSTELPAGTRAGWDSTTRTLRCLSCMPADAATVPAMEPAAAAKAMPAVTAATRAGASARREYDKRSQRREVGIRARHPKLAGLILALRKEPAHTRVWAQGARGERAVAAKLEELTGRYVAALHDRAPVRPDGRASRANIDHLVVSATGVWVVDAKTHQGRLEVRRSGGVFSPRVEKLYIGGRDKTSLLDRLAKQVHAVREVLQQVDAAVAVQGALCFVGTELPWFDESIQGVPLVGRRGLAKLLKRPDDLGPEDREAVVAFLASRFPAAR